MYKEILHFTITGKFNASSTTYLTGIVQPQTITGFLTAFFNQDKINYGKEFNTEDYFKQPFIYFTGNEKFFPSYNRQSVERMNNAGKKQGIYEQPKIYQKIDLIIFITDDFKNKYKKIFKKIQNEDYMEDNIRFAGTNINILSCFNIKNINLEQTNKTKFEFLIDYIYKNITKSRIMFKSKFLKNLNEEKYFFKVLNEEIEEIKNINAYTLPIINGIKIMKNFQIKDFSLADNILDIVHFKQVNKIPLKHENIISYENIFPVLEYKIIENNNTEVIFYEFKKIKDIL